MGLTTVKARHSCGCNNGSILSMETIMTTAAASLTTHLAALSMGLSMLCAGTLAVIGGTGLALWIAGIH